MEMAKHKDGIMVEKEFLSPLDICDSKDKLVKTSIGWAKNPIFNCNINGHYLRKKKWNYWYLVNDSIFFSATVSDLDYIGMVFIYYYSFKTGKFFEKTISSFLAKGCSLSQNVQGIVKYESKDVNVSFNSHDEKTHILISLKDFAGSPLLADLSVIYPKGHETINVVIPWSDNVFQFTSKHNCLPVEGNVTLDGKSYVFDAGTSFANLDFGRGIWPYKSMWNWATASGLQEGHRIGLNLGGKWTDGTGMCENGILVDGKVSKLSENIDFFYDKDNLMNPWEINSTISDRVRLTFTPIYHRGAKTNALIIYSFVHQMVGTFKGYIISENGDKIIIKGLKGAAEEHHAKW